VYGLWRFGKIGTTHLLFIDDICTGAISSDQAQTSYTKEKLMNGDFTVN